MNLHEKAPGVFINHSNHAFTLQTEEIDLLIKSCAKSPKGRSRICVHKNDDELIQQMLIAMPRGHYVQPHKHLDKTESYQVVYGEALFIHYHDNGEIESIQKLNNNTYFLKPKDSVYHAIYILSDHFVFMETTNGPFSSNSSIPSDWAPSEVESNIKIFPRVS